MSSKKKPAVKGAPRPSKKASKAPIIKETIQAPHVFLPDELNVLNINLRENLDRIETLEGEAKAAAQDFKLRITNHKNNVVMLRKKLSAGEETRAVDAIVTFDAKKREKSYYHPFTDAFIRHEPMTPADFELPMFKAEQVENKSTGAKAPAEAAKISAVDLIKLATADYPSEEKLKAHFATLKKAWPNQYPGAGKTAFKLFVNDIRDCVEAKSPEQGGAEEKGQAKTPMEAALNQAASLSEAPKVPFDMVHAESLDHVTLSKLFTKEAKRMGWNAAQISVMKDLWSQCATEAQYLETIRPHVSDPAGA